MQRTLSVLAMLLTAVHAEAAGTSVRGNIVPIVDVCLVTNCDFTGDPCSSNSDCYVGEVSPSSKFSLSGAGRLKVSVANIVDGAGNDGSGDYIFYAEISGSSVSTSRLMVKIPVVEGRGKVDIDVNTLLGPNGLARIVQARVHAPPDVPADCPGDNSTAALASRANDFDCTTGATVGQAAVVSGGKGTLKYTVTPIVDECDAGFCNYYAPDSCSTNADCSYGSASFKSKMSVKGAGKFKVVLKGVVDSSGMDAAGDYILRLETYDYPSGSYIHNVIKVPVVDGKGKASADLSSRLGPATDTVIFVGTLLSPPVTPMNCPGAGNTAADIISREFDPDCTSGEIIGYAGITPGL